MSNIDINKLKNAKKKQDKTTAQCPACAEAGRDKKGDHLVVYPDGRFSCIKESESDPEHNRRILELCGDGENATPAGRKAIVTVRPYVYEPPKVICQISRCTLEELGLRRTEEEFVLPA